MAAVVLLAGCVAGSQAADAQGSATRPAVSGSGSPGSPGADQIPDPRGTGSATDPATWNNRRLAATLVMAGVPMSSLSRAVEWSRAGIGGFVLFGSPPASLAARIRAVNRAAAGAPPLIASDEEGGAVQRLAASLGRLPSARQQGTMSAARVQQLAADYGAGMRRLGVNVDLAPVADLDVRGRFISRDGRAFSADPATVGSYVIAASRGLREAGVLAVVKHWPGHGSASDTHVGSGKTPAWSWMLGHDEVPFRAALAAGVPAVMVGHLTVPGLTEARTPASLSPNAISTLRAEAGPDVLIMTDSLSMGAVTTALHQSANQAAVRALIAGADIAMVNIGSPLSTVKYVAAALRDGSLPREQAIASARRVLAAQQAG